MAYESEIVDDTLWRQLVFANPEIETDGEDEKIRQYIEEAKNKVVESGPY